MKSVINSLILAGLMLISNTSLAQPIMDSLSWLSTDTVGKRFVKFQRPVFLYFYTNNCETCREMEKTTFSNPEVANYIKYLFYPVKVDAESKDSITFFDGTKYGQSVINAPYNDLAKTLLGTIDTFPAFVIFGRTAKGQVFKGLKDRDEIFRSLIYYAEDIDKTMEYPDWYRIHKKGFPPGKSQIMTRLLVKWKTLEEAEEAKRTLPKKMILNFYNYNKISCSLMRTEVFNHPTIAAYLNEKFYNVNIDVFTKDTLEIFGQKYINENQPHKYHQLPIAALEGLMTFPAFIVLDEKGKVLEKIRVFLTPESIEPVLHYYGDNAYLTKTWEEFKTEFKSQIPVKKKSE